jgi:hypothetical protein
MRCPWPAERQVRVGLRLEHATGGCTGVGLATGRTCPVATTRRPGRPRTRRRGWRARCRPGARQCRSRRRPAGDRRVPGGRRRRSGAGRQVAGRGSPRRDDPRPVGQGRGYRQRAPAGGGGQPRDAAGGLGVMVACPGGCGTGSRRVPARSARAPRRPVRPPAEAAGEAGGAACPNRWPTAMVLSGSRMTRVRPMTRKPRDRHRRSRAARRSAAATAPGPRRAPGWRAGRSRASMPPARRG